MCEVAEVGEGEAVEDSLTVDVTEISPWPQPSRGLKQLIKTGVENLRTLTVAKIRPFVDALAL